MKNARRFGEGGGRQPKGVAGVTYYLARLFVAARIPELAIQSDAFSTVASARLIAAHSPT